MRALHNIKTELKQAANTSQQALEGILKNNDAASWQRRPVRRLWAKSSARVLMSRKHP